MTLTLLFIVSTKLLQIPQSFLFQHCQVTKEKNNWNKFEIFKAFYITKIKRGYLRNKSV